VKLGHGNEPELHVMYRDQNGRAYSFVTQFRDDERDMSALKPVSLKMIEQLVHAIDEGLPRK
jgi:hypothetical protein